MQHIIHKGDLRIVLAEFYSLDFFTSGTGTIDADLIFDPGVTARGEVIATLQNLASDELTLTDSAFTFV